MESGKGLGPTIYTTRSHQPETLRIYQKWRTSQLNHQNTMDWNVFFDLLASFFFQISPSKNSINDFPKFFSYFSDFSLVYKHIHQIPSRKKSSEKKRPDLASSAELKRPSWGVNAFNNSCRFFPTFLGPLRLAVGWFPRIREPNGGTWGEKPPYEWQKIHGRSHLPTLDFQSLDTHDGLPPSYVRDDGCVQAMYVLCM